MASGSASSAEHEHTLLASLEKCDEDFMTPVKTRTSAGSAVKEELGDASSPSMPATPGSSARRRRGSGGRGSARSPATASVKSEGDGMDDKGDEDTDKDCMGCGRNSLRGRCWARPDDTIGWALTHHRGQWCKDCHNLWRLTMGQDTSLAMLSVHLKSSPQVAGEWFLNQLGYHSLRREGVERVSQAALVGRVDLVRWLLGAIGIPWMDFEVASLSSLSREAQPPRAADLVTLRMDDGSRRLGAILQVPSSRQAASTFERPQDGSWLGLPMRPTLASDAPEDAEAFRRMYDTGAITTKVVLDTKAGVSPERKTLSKEAKKINNNLRSQVANGQAMLQAFEGDDWKDLKEMNFSQVIAKLQLHKIAAAEEQVVWMIEKADDWVNGLSLAKAFLKRWKESNKSKGHRKFGGLDDLCSRLCEFLRKQDIIVGSSFLLVRVKARFQRETERPVGIGERFADICDIGLFNVLNMMPADGNEGVTPDSYLRGLLAGEVAQLVEEAKPEDIEDRRPALHGDIKKILGHLQSYHKKCNLASIMQDTEQLVVLLEAGLPETTRTHAEVVAAKKHFFDHARLAVLTRALWEHPCGIELMSPANELEQKGIHDDLADQRFNTGLACFRDLAIFRLDMRTGGVSTDGAGIKEEPSASMVVVKNASMALEGSRTITTVLIDAMSQATEGMKLWSARRREERFDDIVRFFRSLDATMKSIDMVGVFEALRACDGPLAGILDPQLDLDQMPGLLTELSNALRVLPRVSTDDIVLALKNSAKRFSAEGLPEIHEEMVKVARKASQNAEARVAIFRVLSSISHLSEFKVFASSTEAVEEWHAQGDKSLLAAAMHLYDDLAHLGSLDNFDFDGFCLSTAVAGEPPVLAAGDSGLKIVTTEGGNTSIDMDRILALGPNIVKSPVVAFAKTVLDDCLSEMCDKVFTLTMTEALVRVRVDPSKMSFQNSAIADIVASFVKSATMAPALAAVGAYVKHPDGHPLRVDAAIVSLSRLVNATGAETVQLSHLVLKSCATKVSVGALLSLCDLYGELHKVAAIMVWLSNTVVAGSALAQDKLKCEVETAIHLMMTAQTEATAILERHDDAGSAHAIPDEKLIFSVSDAKTWVSACSAALPFLQKCVLDVVVARVKELMTITKSGTPAYDHFLTDELFNFKLIKAKLLTWKGQEKLTKDSVALWQATTEASRLHKKFQLPLIPEDQVDDVAEALAQASYVFKDAKRAIVVFLGVLALYTYTGDVQTTEIKKLCDSKKDMLPKTLLAELQKVRLNSSGESASSPRDGPFSKRAKVTVKTT